MPKDMLWVRTYDVEKRGSTEMHRRRVALGGLRKLWVKLFYVWKGSLVIGNAR